MLCVMKGDSMLTVTEAAGARLAQLLDQADPPEGAVIRLVLGTAGKLALQFAHRNPDDTTFEHDSRTVLVYGAQIASMLVDSTLDVQNADAGPKLVLRR
jgi:Fe-S cluster assembly iron-binding protein IscA